MKLNWSEAMAALVREGYGYVSARGMLAIADSTGTLTDGEITVRSNRAGYQVSVAR